MTKQGLFPFYKTCDIFWGRRVSSTQMQNKRWQNNWNTDHEIHEYFDAITEWSFRKMCVFPQLSVFLEFVVLKNRCKKVALIVMGRVWRK